MKDNDSKREHRLLKIWLDKAPVNRLLVSHFGFARLEQVFKDKLMIELTIGFDYNKQTFVPTHSPVFMPLSTEMQNNPNAVQGTAVVVVQIQYQQQEKQSLTFIETRCYRLGDLAKVVAFNEGGAYSSWDELGEQVLPLYNTILKSSLFNSWQLLRVSTFNEQLKYVLESSHYRCFIVHALHINTLQPRHKTHVVMIHVKWGMSLGQISHLTGYKVLSLEQVKECLHERLPPVEALERCRTWLVDLEQTDETTDNHPPKNMVVRLPVIFDVKSGLTMKPLFVQLTDNNNDETARVTLLSQSQSNIKARESFAQLTKISFPAVTSPELH